MRYLYSLLQLILLVIQFIYVRGENRINKYYHSTYNNNKDQIYNSSIVSDNESKSKYSDMLSSLILSAKSYSFDDTHNVNGIHLNSTINNINHSSHYNINKIQLSKLYIQNSTLKNNIVPYLYKNVTSYYNRTLQTIIFDGSKKYYITNKNISLLPQYNYDIAIGNPLKGLCPNSGNININLMSNSSIPATLANIKIPINIIMLNDPDIVGEIAAFNWTIVEEKLIEVENNYMHLIIRFYYHYRGKPLNVPSYLFQSPYKIDTIIDYRGEIALLYNNIHLRKAAKQFLYAFAKKYDGDKRIYAIQAGIIGYWGEWHTSGCTYIDPITNQINSCLPDDVKYEMIQWYQDAFNKSYIQFRYPSFVIPTSNKIGYHDDSFTFSTLGGIYNGNESSNYFFWTSAQNNNVTTFWKTAPMGGEMRPENGDIIFTDKYPSNTKNKQDFNECVKITHTTHITYYNGWAKGGPIGTILTRARYAHARMGYNFEIDNVIVIPISYTMINMNITLKQTGVAPFYFPLYLSLYCTNKNNTLLKTSDLIDTTKYLIEQNSFYIVSIKNISITSECLNSIEFKLVSPKLYNNSKIKWAQGNNNGRIILNIPSIPTILQSVSSPTSIIQPTPPSTIILKPVTSVPTNTQILPPNPIPQMKLPIISPIPQMKPPIILPIPQMKPPLILPIINPVSPIKQPSNMPIVRIGDESGSSIKCYIVCARRTFFCIRKKRSKDLSFGGSYSYIRKLFSMQLSIQCNTSPNIDSIIFTYDNDKSFKSTTKPFSMNGITSSGSYKTVKYLSYSGLKLIKIRAYQGKSLIDQKILEFRTKMF